MSSVTSAVSVGRRRLAEDLDSRRTAGVDKAGLGGDQRIVDVLWDPESTSNASTMFSGTGTLCVHRLKKV